MEISELSKTKSLQLAALRSAKLQRKHKIFLAEGIKCVADTCFNFELYCIVLTDELLCRIKDASPSSDQSLLKLKDFINNPANNHLIYRATHAELKKLSTLSTPPEIIAYYNIPATKNDFIIDKDKLYLLLDGIQNPGNMGTIIRTAHWFGIDTVFASKDCVDIYNSKCVQSTMGSLSAVKVYYIDIIDLIINNKEIPTYGLILNGENIYNSKYRKGGFIVMGNEGTGISPQIIDLITHPLTIPPYNPDCHSESLNVSIATAITLSIFRDPSHFLSPSK